MDELDIKIIKILEENSRTSISDISRKINLSRCSVKERISKLIETNIIKTFSIKTCPYKKGYGIIFIVLIYEVFDSNLNINEYLNSNPNVMQAYYTAGIAQYIFKVAVPNIESMYHFIHKLQKTCKIETLIILDNISDKNLEPKLNMK